MAKDLDGDGDIDGDDNLNPPWPLPADDADNPNGAAASQALRHIQCPGAPVADAYIFNPEDSSFPQSPNGVNDWRWINTDDGGVRRVGFAIHADLSDPIMTMVFNRLGERVGNSCKFNIASDTDMRFEYFLYKESC